MSYERSMSFFDLNTKWRYLPQSGDPETPEVPHEAVERVREIGPSGRRCLLQNVEDDGTILEYVRCLPTHKKEVKGWIPNLEWFWGLKYRSFDLNTPHNIFPLDSRLRATYERASGSVWWLLVPEDSIVDVFNSYLSETSIVDGKPWFYAEREKLPKLEGSIFNYRLIPVSYKMNAITIKRQDPPGNFCAYESPFVNFPLIPCHLDPKFVIFEAGRRLYGGTIPWKNFEYLRANDPSIQKIINIYVAWASSLPPEAEQDIDFKSEDDSDDDSDDDDADVATGDSDCSEEDISGNKS